MCIALWNSGNSLVTVETDLEGMHKEMERMSKNKSERMPSEKLMETKTD